MVKKQAIIETSTFLKEALAKSKLPEVSQKKLLERFKEAEKTDGVEAAIVEEAKYLESVGVKLTETRRDQRKTFDLSHNISDPGSGGGDGNMDLTESFREMGLSKEQAEVAARA